MALELKCKIVEKLHEERGNSARGPWCKQNFIVETIESYPRKICMNVWGDDKVSELRAYNIGETLNVSINIGQGSSMAVGIQMSELGESSVSRFRLLLHLD